MQRPKKLPNDPLNNLPTDLLINIALHLDSKGLQALFLACKHTNTLFNQDSFFWKQKYLDIMKKVTPASLEKFAKADSAIDYRKESLQQVFFKPELARIFTAKVPVYKKLLAKNKEDVTKTFYEEYELSSKGYGSRSIKLSQLKKFIEEDNFYDFIKQATYFSALLPYIRDAQFQNIRQLQRAIEYNNKWEFFASLDLNLSDFDFIYRILPFAVEKNLCNFFNGLTNFLMMYMLVVKVHDIPPSFEASNKFEMAVATIFASGKSYFIESFLHNLNKLPKLTQNQFYPILVRQICAFEVDLKIILQNEQTSKNLYDYLSHKIISGTLPKADRESHLLLFLRLLKGFSQEQQVKSMELIVKTLKGKGGSPLKILENLLGRDEFADLKLGDKTKASPMSIRR